MFGSSGGYVRNLRMRGVVVMHQALKRRLSVALAATLVVAIGAGAASASASKARFGTFAGRGFAQRGGFGPSFGPGGPGLGFGLLGGLGGGQQGFGAFGLGGFGPGGRGAGGPGAGNASILGSDILTPAASFLGVSVSTLEADLKGGKTLAQEAVAKGKTAADLISAVVSAEKNVLDAENAAGWITDSQETSLVSSLTTQITDLVNNGPPIPPTQKTPSLLQTASTYLGVSVSDLQADLKAGKTLASVATAQGKTADGLVQALVAVAKTSLDAQVTAGTITQAQEGTIIARITTQLTNFVNNTKSSAAAAQTNTKLMALYRKA
jgi:D-Tyr-tRNAtyr deacylase